MRRDQLNKTAIKLATATFATLLIASSSVAAQEQQQDTINIKDIVVTGTRNETNIRHLPMSVSSIKSEVIENRNEQSIIPILTEQVPSLFTTARGVMGYGVSTGASGTIKMRGIGGTPTTGMLVLIDGHPQYMGIMGHSIADAYQSMIAEKIEVVRGPASVLYGSNAMGGVINILTHKQKEDGIKNDINIGYGSYNSLTTEVSNSIRKKGFSSQIVGSYNRTDGHRENMEFEQYGGYAKLGYEFSKNWNIFTDLSLTHYNASNPGESYNPIYDNDSRITRGMSSISLDNSYKNTSGALKFFYNWGEHTINEGYYSGGEPKDYLFNSNDKMFGINLFQSVKLFEGNRLTAGFDYQKFGGVARNIYSSGESVETVNKYENSVATYLDFRQSIAQIITLDAGVRLDNHSSTGTHIIPQFGASFYPTSSGEVKLIASRGFRNPTIKEMYMFATQNPDLLPESLWNYEISWRQRAFTDRLSYEVALFYIKGDNMIQTVPVDGVATNVNSGEVENWGVELSLAYRLSALFNLSSNYSYLDMRYAIIAAPKHKLYAGVDFHKNRWSASTGVQYIKGLFTYVGDDGNITENYILWNSQVGYQISKTFGAYLKGENLLDQDYEINRGFAMPGTTVMCGVKVRF
ncbi:MAG: TonB-dependent receptor [Rikenellaceae bacterium]